MLRCSSSRNNANTFATRRVNNKQDYLARCHPNDDEAIFAVIFAIIQALHRKCIPEYRLRQLKSNSMEPIICIRFDRIPFKFQILILRDSSTLFNLLRGKETFDHRLANASRVSAETEVKDAAEGQRPIMNGHPLFASEQHLFASEHRLRREITKNWLISLFIKQLQGISIR